MRHINITQSPQFIDEIPTDAMAVSGQIKMNNDASSRNAAVLEEVTDLLRELHPDEASMPVARIDAHMDRELGLDSLSRMELLARLEKRLHVTFPERLAAEAQTPGDLVRALSALRAPTTLATPGFVVEPADRDIPVPHDASTLPDVLAWHAQKHPGRTHVHFAGGDVDGIELTYAQLYTSACETAGGLQHAGLRAGEAVALMFPTEPDLLIAFFGVMLAGGVPVPLYPPMRANELGEYWRRQGGILRNCDARLMIVASLLFEHRHAMGALAGGVERLWTVGALRDTGAPLQPMSHRGDDLAMLQYTSGSTADPKGVMLSHDNLLANIRIMGRLVDASAKDTFVSWLPLYHDMGLIGAWLGSLYFGIPLVLMPPQSFLLHPDEWLRALHRFRATLSAAPNFAYELCMHRIEQTALEGLDLSHLRVCFCGAEPVFPETMERFIARLAPQGFSPGALLPVYGLAENSLGLTFPPPGRGVKVLRVDQERFLRLGQAIVTKESTEPSLAFVSCGAPLPQHELRIVDERDRALPEGQQGRIQFQGPCATKGYFHNPVLTRELFHGPWLDTGDLGFLLAGELYLTGRVKDVIIRAGQHLHPQSIEQAVGNVPGIRRGRVAAFGSRSQGTERLIVVAETRQADPALRDALRDAVNAAVQASAGAPADDVVLAAPGTVLKTSSGKLRRSACQAAYESGRLEIPDRLRLLKALVRAQRDRLRRTTHRLGLRCYGIYAWLLLCFAAPLLLAGLALPLSFATRWRLVRRSLRALSRAAGIPVKVNMVAEPPPRPCIFVCNHASYVDALALLCALPRPVTFLAKQELANQPVLGWVLNHLGVTFVARSDIQASTRAVDNVQRGQRDVLFFPEGTFRRMPGLLHFRLGAFLSAARANLAIVPVALNGTRTVLPDGEWLPRPSLITVTIANAVLPQASSDHWHEALRLASLVRACLLEHCGEPDAGDVRLEMPTS